MTNEEMIIRFKMRCVELGFDDPNGVAAICMFSNMVMTIAADVLYEAMPDGWTGGQDRQVVTAKLLNLVWRFSVDAAQVAKEHGPESVSVTLPIKLDSVKEGAVLNLLQRVLALRGFDDSMTVHGIIGTGKVPNGN